MLWICDCNDEYNGNPADRTDSNDDYGVLSFLETDLEAHRFTALR